MMKQLFLVLPAVFTLAACQTMGRVGESLDSLGVSDAKITTIPQGDCPSVSRVAELASIYQFTVRAMPIDAEKISEAHITRIDTRCGMADDQLVLDLTLGVDGAVGPRGRRVPTEKPSFMYPYFVTVLDSRNTILFKDMHALSVNYDAQLNQSSQVEQVQVRVPGTVLNGAVPRDMRILVGFQLSPDEIRYNRTLPTDQLGKTLAAPVDTPVPGVGTGSAQETIEALKKGH